MIVLTHIIHDKACGWHFTLRKIITKSHRIGYEKCGHLGKVG